MKITQKSQRRARARLLAQAESEANESKIRLVDAVLSIIERAGNPELIIKAFTRLDDSPSHAEAQKAEITAYLDTAS